MVFPDRLDIIPSVSMMPSKEAKIPGDQHQPEHPNMTILIHSGHMFVIYITYTSHIYIYIYIYIYISIYDIY